MRPRGGCRAGSRAAVAPRGSRCIDRGVRHVLLAIRNHLCDLLAYMRDSPGCVRQRHRPLPSLTESNDQRFSPTIVLKLLLLIFALATLPATATGQNAPPELDRPRRETGVTLTTVGFLLPSASGALALPAPLLERLATEGALLSVDTAPVDGRIVVQVRFGFADVAGFRQWYADGRTVQLLAELKAATMGGSFETYVSYRPAAGP